MRCLTVNAGSTSMKITRLDGEDIVDRYDSLDEAVAAGERIDAVLHRVVHGGDRSAPVVVDDAVEAELRALTELAPLHQPPALDALGRCRSAWPDAPHVACFDTAFHATIPEAARTYALPAELRRQVRAYGFHGLSHAWAVSRVRELAPEARRVVVAHLGGGQSLCAALDGRSIATTMGFTPLDGLVMATRSGSIDPGAVLWLADRVDGLADVLEHESGLKGLSGTDDMRELLDRHDDEARFALDVYLHRLVWLLGGCVAALEGLDALVFTGGIGEHAERLRELVGTRLGWIGPSVQTFVVEAREDLQMVRDAVGVL
ncbi:MAG: acetate/propionate family kinase [Acidimicrobiia bacterium]|nr:acetate/propionate family kinase [Acidimicrobiia bacterium]